MGYNSKITVLINMLLTLGSGVHTSCPEVGWEGDIGLLGYVLPVLKLGVEHWALGHALPNPTVWGDLCSGECTSHPVIWGDTGLWDTHFLLCNVG